jgi:lipoate-protein ligase B
MSPTLPPIDAEAVDLEILLTLEGEAAQRMTLGALFAANEALDEQERLDIMQALRHGQTYHGGGGAAAAYRLDWAPAP